MISVSRMAVVVLFVATASCTQPEEDHRPPNILMIMIDDLGWTDLHVQGNALLETPVIDRLAREGYRAPDPINVFGNRIRELQTDLRQFLTEITSKQNMPLLIKTQLYLFDCFLNGGAKMLQTTVDETLPLREFWEKKPS